MGIPKELWSPQIKHGGSKTPEYRAWKNMKSRCYHNTPRKKFYTDRGIIVCPEWLGNFEQFLKDVGPRPGTRYSLGRINNDGNYEPGNVRWETYEQQNSNTSFNVNLTHNKQTKILFEWARELKIKPNTLVNRIGRYGWPVEQALTTPVGVPRKRVI